MSRKSQKRRQFEHGGKPKAERLDAQSAKPEETTARGGKGTGEPCSVVDMRCTAPAGWRAGNGYAVNHEANAEFECSECGQPVCGACSGVQNGRRVCDDCNAFGSSRM